MRDLAGSGPFTVFAPWSSAFDEDLRVSMVVTLSGTEPVSGCHPGTHSGYICGQEIQDQLELTSNGRGAASQHRDPYRGKHSSGFGVTAGQRSS